MQKLPTLSTYLIKELDEMYPPVTPRDDITDRELWGRIYQRRLVDNLLSLLTDPTVYEKD